MRQEKPLLSTRLALRPPEAAQALGISERKLRELLPQIPHARLGGVVVIPVEALREWLRELAQQEARDTDQVVKDLLDTLVPGG